MKKINSRKVNKKWITLITIASFLISLILALISELVIPNTWIGINIILVLIFIFLGIITDIIGVSVTTCKEEIFHSMATKKVAGAKKAIKLIKNKEKVSSFCNDVIGDICGVISGSCGISIALKLSVLLHINLTLVTVIITALISSLTIGGKAIGKTFSVNHSDKVLYGFSKILCLFTK